jgi:purine-cytosine permease-like protein
MSLVSRIDSWKHIENTEREPPRPGIIGYWSAVFATIILAEHFVFRRRDFSLYDLTLFNKPKLLPPGIAAVFAFWCAVGIIVPSMSQVWYTGPIAASGTGDIGILAGSAVALVVYLGARAVEKSVFHR